MGILDSIFGGGGDSSTEQAPTLTSGQRSLLDALTDLLAPQVGAGVTPFQGETVAPFSQLQQQALGSFGGLAPLGQSLFDIAGQSLGQFDPNQSQGFLGQAQGALQRGLQPVDTQAISDAFAPSRELAVNQFERNTIPQLLERFGATSGGSGSLQRELAQAGGDLSLGLAAQQAPFVGQAALQAPGLQQAGAGLAGNLAQLPGQLAQQGAQIGGLGSDLFSQLLNVGGIQQGQEQALLNEALSKFQQSQPFNNPFLQAFLRPALGTQAVENITSVQQPSGGIFGALAPALGSFAGSDVGSTALARLFGI